MGSGLIVLAILLWWPLDGLVIPEGSAREAFAQLRRGTLAVLVPTLVVFAASRPSLLPTLVLSTIATSGFLGVVGVSLGSIGGEDLGWFGDACLGVMVVAWIPMPIAVRVASTSVVGGALALGYFGAHPTNLDHPGAWGQLSFLLFAVTLAIVVGEAWYRVTRMAFFARLDLAEANESLAAAGRDLSRQVDERTDQLRSLAEHLDTRLETERRRIGHELHDDLAQRLTAMRYVVARLERRISPMDDSHLTRPLTQELTQLLDGMSGVVREVTSRLRPRILEDMGLAAALEWLCEATTRRTSIECDLTLDASTRHTMLSLTPTHQLALFRAAQEGLTNALRHAAPRHVEIHVARDGSTLVLRVTDDGEGSAQPPRSPPGLGLLGLRERFKALDGRCDFRRRDGGGGSQLVAELPLPMNAEAEELP